MQKELWKKNLVWRKWFQNLVKHLNNLKRKMRVLFVSSGNSKFGISPIVKNQADSLNRSGISVDFFPVQGKGFLGYLAVVPKIRRQINKGNYDLVHAHYSFSAFSATLASHLPIVVSLMGSDLKSNKAFVKIINFFGNRFWSRTIIKSAAMNNGLTLKKIDILPNGVDFECFRPLDKLSSLKKINWDASKKHILFAANPKVAVKNFKLAQGAIEQLKRDDLELHFLEFIPNDEMPYYYNAADVVLLTSLREGSPNVIKEAMACSIPIVSTDVGDVRAVIGTTKGCYIASFDPKDVADKIMKALDFGKRTTGREAIKHLDSSLVAKKLIDLYDEVINDEKLEK